ncbi:hypothetical protein AWN88_25665 [Agrobacterium tumefaciens]|nr:hypothetical protein AWN88_25665 [Agrobacterium tumefaciens]
MGRYRQVPQDNGIDGLANDKDGAASAFADLVKAAQASIGNIHPINPSQPAQGHHVLGRFAYRGLFFCVLTGSSVRKRVHYQAIPTQQYDPCGGTAGDPLKEDFKVFLFLIWKHLNLPEPTRSQYVMAEWLQTGPIRLVIEAFRGIGKSWVTAAYVCWLLYRDPQLKIMVVSASKLRADDFSTFTLRLIHEVPFLKHLMPRDGQRSSKIAFDVGPARADQSPSVKSVGITGQLTGSRADVIIADDIEVTNNSATQTMRDKLKELTKEFAAILKPLDTSKIIYLGTPQTEQSIYNSLPSVDTRSGLSRPNIPQRLKERDTAPALRHTSSRTSNAIRGSSVAPCAVVSIPIR